MGVGLHTQLLFAVNESSQVAEARRSAVELARRTGFTETDVGTVAIMVTEAATNMVKHASEGELLVRCLANSGGAGLEIIAIDRGPGMGSPEAAMRDGYSTAGSPGTGLGAMRRLASTFDIYSAPGKGCALRMTLWTPASGEHSEPLQLGAVCVPKPGEEVCGDAWFVKTATGRFTVLVADGLGHGVDAGIAAEAAADVLRAQPAGSVASPADLIEAAHGELRATRGAALGVMEVSVVEHKARFAGVGNVAASVRNGDISRQLVSHNGIVGGNVRKVQEFEAAWETGAVLIMHSDGLGTHWDLGTYPGLTARHPGLIAGVLYRDFARRRDDVTVIVAKYTSEPSGAPS